MTALAYFHCRPNSHPFQDRQLTLKEPVKIGRSVARCRPASNNAVFDCKVLSRNHALLWYENGKFYLQDTKSSNGTFVNNQRLSKASEESPAVEVNSCDIVQFGVDVVDNTKKVTHGCIVSQLRLYLPNGDEAKQSNHAWNNQIMDKVPYNNAYPVVQSQDLYQLHQYLQEALHREQMLEQKLALLQRLVVKSHDASEKGWQALIDEDRLLSRLEFLENQLQTLNKSQDEDSLQTKLQQTQEDKYLYEKTSKETLRQALQEKLEAVGKLSNLERSLSNTEDECTHLRLMHEQTQNELTELAAAHQSKVKDIQEISEKLQETERKNKETMTELEGSREELQARIEQIIEEKEKLTETFQLCQEENNRLQQLELTAIDLKNNNPLEEKGVQAEPTTNLDSDHCDITTQDSSPDSPDLSDENHNFKEANQEIVQVEVVMDSSEDPISPTSDGPEDLKETLSLAKLDALENINEVALLRKELEEREKEMEQRLNDVTMDLKQQLDDVQKNLDNKSIIVEKLQGHIDEMERQNTELKSAHQVELESKKQMEEEMLRFQDEKERQTAALNEASSELQAALSARESLFEREERVRVEVEESERMLNIFNSSSSSSGSVSETEEVDTEDKSNVTPPAFLIFKAKLKEVRSQLKSSDKKLEETKEENKILKDRLQSMEAESQAKSEAVQEMESPVVQNAAPQVETDQLQTTSNTEPDGNSWSKKLEAEKAGWKQQMETEMAELKKNMEAEMAELKKITEAEKDDLRKKMEKERDGWKKNTEAEIEDCKQKLEVEIDDSWKQKFSIKEAEMAEFQQLLALKAGDVESLKKELEDSQTELERFRKLTDEQNKEIKDLKGELVDVRQTAESVPQLQSDIAMLTSSGEEREKSFVALQQKLADNQLDLDQSKTDVATLKEKSAVDQESIATFGIEASLLKEELATKLQHLANSEESCAEMKQKMEECLKTLAQKEELIAALEEKIGACCKEKEQIKLDFDEISTQLKEALREREEVSCELKRIRESTSIKEQSLVEELERNKTLLNASAQEKEKLTSACDVMDSELSEVTTRCRELIRERESVAGKEARGKAMFFLGLLIAILAVATSFILLN